MTCAASAQLRRRREAARRVPPLACGCPDPWPCRCTEPPFTEHGLDGWASAARHLRSTGKTPLLPLEVLRALHRRGGADRELAESLHAETAGVVA